MSLSPVFMKLARAIVVTSGLAACTTIPASEGANAASACRHIQSGKASWYGEEMAVRKKGGRYIFNRTASGEAFHPGGISAAHKTLPLGTRVKVVTQDNRALSLRINDRGPYAGGRILDLSRGAAERLGIKARGEAFVRLYRCG